MIQNIYGPFREHASSLFNRVNRGIPGEAPLPDLLTSLGSLLHSTRKLLFLVMAIQGDSDGEVYVFAGFHVTRKLSH